MSLGASMRWVLARRRLVIVAWLLVAVVGLATGGEGEQRAALVFLTPAVTVEQPPEPTPWDTDYWLRRFPDHEQA
jgi:hypothetical protein